MANELTSNIDEISKLFSKLPGNIQKRVVRKVNRRGIALIVKKAKLLAPVKTGAGKKQFRIRAIKVLDKSTETGHTVIFDTPKGSKTAPYMYFQEVGTKNGLKPKLFLQTAFDVMEERAARKIMDDFSTELEKELLKNGWTK